MSEIPDLPVRRKPVESRLGVVSISLLGMGRLVGGRCKFWNAGLSVGTDYFLAFTALECIGIILMASCLAEMAGALPFTGGTFGYARGIYGPYLGFMVAILEVLTNIFSMASLMLTFGQACTYTLAINNAFQPVFYLVLFAVTVIIQCLKIRSFTAVIHVLVTISLILTALYILGSVPYVNFQRYAYEEYEPPFSDDRETERVGALAILGYAAIPSYFFTGLEMLPILAHNAETPRKAITYGLLSTVIFGVVTIFLTCIVAVGQYPGRAIISQAYAPLNYGFSRLFGMPLSTASVFNIPLLLVSFVIGQYLVSIIICSMADSSLLPSLFNTMYRSAFIRIPLYAVMLSYSLCILSAIVAFICLYNSYRILVNLSFFVALCFFTHYICLFMTYLSFIQRFPTVPRYFVSPFGVYGAYLGIVIFFFFGISTCFVRNGGCTFLGFVLFLMLLTFVYLAYIKRQQKFSAAEERVFFIAYVINGNRRKKHRIMASNRPPPATFWETIQRRFSKWMECFDTTLAASSNSASPANTPSTINRHQQQTARSRSQLQQSRARLHQVQVQSSLSAVNGHSDDHSDRQSTNSEMATAVGPPLTYTPLQRTLTFEEALLSAQPSTQHLYLHKGESAGSSSMSHQRRPWHLANLFHRAHPKGAVYAQASSSVNESEQNESPNNIYGPTNSCQTTNHLVRPWFLNTTVQDGTDPSSALTPPSVRRNSGNSILLSGSYRRLRPSYPVVPEETLAAKAVDVVLGNLSSSSDEVERSNGSVTTTTPAAANMLPSSTVPAQLVSLTFSSASKTTVAPTASPTNISNNAIETAVVAGGEDEDNALDESLHRASSRNLSFTVTSVPEPPIGSDDDGVHDFLVVSKSDRDTS